MMKPNNLRQKKMFFIKQLSEIDFLRRRVGCGGGGLRCSNYFQAFMFLTKVQRQRVDVEPNISEEGERCMVVGIKI